MLIIAVCRLRQDLQYSTTDRHKWRVLNIITVHFALKSTSTEDGILCYRKQATFLHLSADQWVCDVKCLRTSKSFQNNKKASDNITLTILHLSLNIQLMCLQQDMSHLLTTSRKMKCVCGVCQLPPYNSDAPLILYFNYSHASLLWICNC